MSVPKNFMEGNFTNLNYALKPGLFFPLINCIILFLYLFRLLQKFKYTISKILINPTKDIDKSTVFSISWLSISIN